MAKNVTLMGANYPSVPAVALPQTGGGTAMFFASDEVVKIYSENVQNISVINRDYTSVASYKPADNTYNWYLIGLLPAVSAVVLIGIDPGGYRFMMKTETEQNETVTMILTWLGIKAS